MEVQTIYENDGEKNPHWNPSGPWTRGQNRTEAQNRKRNSFVLITVFLGLICVLLVVGILVLYIHLTAERDLMKRSYMNNVEGYNETLNSLKMNYNQLTVEKEELKKTLNYMNQKNLELETKVKNLNDALMKKWSYFISSEKKSWSDSRQFCRDRGQDLVIINTEEEQRYVFSIAKEDVWIGLSDIAEEGKMKWVDNTTLDKGFWGQGEPNDQYGNEDCVVIRSSAESSLNNWNDIPCTQTRTWICENL
ncbi:uncharacterized protein [Paramisgurnus dabryanus]|uniref:uncharacterized protein n=1 Tax=Paramisgurnus dabryanus TaxID=90735 RepID=UPI0031F38599